jgi:hypothetical protein
VYEEQDLCIACEVIPGSWIFTKIPDMKVKDTTSSLQILSISRSFPVDVTGNSSDRVPIFASGAAYVDDTSLV